MPFSERDWMHLRHVHRIARERFCERVLDEAAAIAQERGRSAHARYLALFRLVHERNAAMAAAFDDLRRSTGLRRLSAMVGLDVVTDEDLAGFQPDVREAARAVRDLRPAASGDAAPRPLIDPDGPLVERDRLAVPSRPHAALAAAEHRLARGSRGKAHARA